MLPYVEQPSWHIGPLTIHAFGIAVALAMAVGLTMVRRRCEHDRLDSAIGERLAWWMIVGGVCGAHLFSVLFYFPHELRDDPWLLVRVWEPISSFGGMLGGVVAGFLFFAKRSPAHRRLRLAYFDAVAFVFPAALAIGRFGCLLAHDHPGRVTAFPLAISLKTEAARTYISGIYGAAGLSVPSAIGTMGFHDLGLYEFLFLSVVVVPTFFHWSHQRRPLGFYVVAFCALYLPVRFALDALRVSDARYVGLTPAQWVAALVLAVLPFAAVRRRTIRFAISALVLLITASACWSGSQ